MGIKKIGTGIATALIAAFAIGAFGNVGAQEPPEQEEASPTLIESCITDDGESYSEVIKQDCRLLSEKDEEISESQNGIAFANRVVRNYVAQIQIPEQVLRNLDIRDLLSDDLKVYYDLIPGAIEHVKNLKAEKVEMVSQIENAISKRAANTLSTFSQENEENACGTFLYCGLDWDSTEAEQGSTGAPYANCDDAEANSEELIKGTVGSGSGYPQATVPSARDGDGDGVVCER